MRGRRVWKGGGYRSTAEVRSLKGLGRVEDLEGAPW
jgi:hypothetical protein